MARTVDDVARAVTEIAETWRADRSARQARRGLERIDFDRLRDAGLLGVIVPTDHGGLWQDVTASARGVCELYRVLAAADPSVALVSSMHPAVVNYWLASPDASQPAC